MSTDFFKMGPTGLPYWGKISGESDKNFEGVTKFFPSERFPRRSIIISALNVELQYLFSWASEGNQFIWTILLGGIDQKWPNCKFWLGKSDEFEILVGEKWRKCLQVKKSFPKKLKPRLNKTPTFFPQIRYI